MYFYVKYMHCTNIFFFLFKVTVPEWISIRGSGITPTHYNDYVCKLRGLRLPSVFIMIGWDIYGECC